MKLTTFGRVVRELRLAYDQPLKAMADFLGISSAYLSGIEYGDKRLTEKVGEETCVFFTQCGAPIEDIRRLHAAISESMASVSVEDLSSESRRRVAAFARALRAGKQVNASVDRWIESQM